MMRNDGRENGEKENGKDAVPSSDCIKFTIYDCPQSEPGIRVKKLEPLYYTNFIRHCRPAPIFLPAEDGKKRFPWIFANIFSKKPGLGKISREALRRIQEQHNRKYGTKESYHPNGIGGYVL